MIPPLAWLLFIGAGFASLSAAFGARRFAAVLFLFAAGTLLGAGSLLHALSGRAYALEGWDRGVAWLCALDGLILGWGLAARMAGSGAGLRRVVFGSAALLLLASASDRGRTDLQDSPALQSLVRTVGVVSQSLFMPGPGPSRGKEPGPKGPEAAPLVPDFALPDASGQERTLSGLMRGERTLLFVYSGGCAHCLSRLPALAEFARELSASGVRSVGVEYMGTPASVLANGTRLGLEGPVLADGNGRVCGQLGVGEFTVFALDGGRRVLHRGGLEDRERVAAALRALGR